MVTGRFWLLFGVLLVYEVGELFCSQLVAMRFHDFVHLGHYPTVLRFYPENRIPPSIDILCAVVSWARSERNVSGFSWSVSLFPTGFPFDCLGEVVGFSVLERDFVSVCLRKYQGDFLERFYPDGLLPLLLLPALASCIWMRYGGI